MGNVESLTTEGIQTRITSKVAQEVPPAAAAAAQAYLSTTPAVVSAATAAAEDAVDGILDDSNRIPKAGKINEFRIRDTTGAVAFMVDEAGNTKIFGSSTFGGAEVLEYEGYRVRDKTGAVALDIKPDGKTYVYDPASASSNITRIIPIIGAGQSNMEGRALPYSSELDPANPFIYEYDWTTTQLRQAQVPLSSQQTMNGYSMLTKIANEVLAHEPVGTAVVIIQCAAGGSSMIGTPAQGTWDPAYSGSNPKLYSIMLNTLDIALPKIQAKFGIAPTKPLFFWHQGEADTTEGAYATAFDALVNGVRTHLSAPNMPVVLGGIVPEYIVANPTRANVRAAHIGAQSRLFRVAYADGISNGGGSASVTDLVHYAREAAEKLGKNMYQACRRALANVSGSIPAVPQEVNATFISGKLTVKHSFPFCRATSFIVEYSIDGGAWVAASKPIPLDLITVVTGLTGSVVMVRVSTVNEVGTSQTSTPITALGA